MGIIRICSKYLQGFIGLYINQANEFLDYLNLLIHFKPDAEKHFLKHVQLNIHIEDDKMPDMFVILSTDQRYLNIKLKHTRISVPIRANSIGSKRSQAFLNSLISGLVSPLASLASLLHWVPATAAMVMVDTAPAPS